MNLIKTTGIVIKEVNYADNDKIITIISKELGKISCMVKGARKQNNPNLSSSQYLVYSEFILYEGKNFYHVNSSSVIDTFYSLRIDYDKLQVIFEFTKLLYTTVQENQNSEDILRLFLNTLAYMKDDKRNRDLLISIFNIKLATYLGYSLYLDKCSVCYGDIGQAERYLYSFHRNGIVCDKCREKVNDSNYTISDTTKKTLKYITVVKQEKLFNFTLKQEVIDELYNFSKIYINEIKAGM